MHDCLNTKTSPALVTLLVLTDEGVLAGYHSAEQAEAIVRALNDEGVNAWLEEVPTNPQLITHIVTSDRNTIETLGRALIVSSVKPMTLGQGRKVASFLEQDGRTIVGYGFGADNAIACMLSRAGIGGECLATELAA